MLMKLLTLRLLIELKMIVDVKMLGRIYVRKTNCSLFNGRKEIIDDCEITNFFKSSEKDDGIILCSPWRDRLGGKRIDQC